MLEQARKYKHPEELLHAKIVLSMCFDVKANEFSASARTMVQLLKLYPNYHAPPAGIETKRSAALKVANALVLTLSEDAFASLLSRAAQLSLNVVTTRPLPLPDEELDLSDMEDIPLSTNTKFSSHRSAILDEKDGLLAHKAIATRIEAMAKERTIVREWSQSERDENAEVAVGVVKTYANKDVSSYDSKRVQQYLLKCLTHRLKILQAKAGSEPKVAEVPRTLSCSSTATELESASSGLPSDSEAPKYHSSGALLPPPPESGLGADHPYNSKVVNTAEVQLVQPRVPHPITAAHATACMSLVTEIEQMQEGKDFAINTDITDKLSRWFCPPISS